MLVKYISHLKEVSYSGGFGASILFVTQIFLNMYRPPIVGLASQGPNDSSPMGILSGLG